jgi:uncharacterized membrane protein
MKMPLNFLKQSGKKKDSKTGIDKIKKWSLSIAILIVLVGFVMIGIQTFYPDPLLGKHCWETMRMAAPMPVYKDCYANTNKTVQEECLNQQNAEQIKYQEEMDTCNKEEEKITHIYNRDVSIILVIIGLVTLIVAILLLKVNSVSNGFTFGGIFLIFLSLVKYWSDMQDLMRFVILGIVLAVLVWLGYKKMDSRNEESKDKKK